MREYNWVRFEFLAFFLFCLQIDNLTDTILSETGFIHKIGKGNSMQNVKSGHITKPYYDKNEEQELIDIILQASKPLQQNLPGIQPNLQSMRSVKVFLFDLYGTLFISGSGDIGTASEETRIEKNMEKALKKAGISPVKPDTPQTASNLYVDAIRQVHTAKKGQDISFPEVDIFNIWHSVLSDLRKQNHIEVNPDHKLVSKLALWFEVINNPVWPMPHAGDILSYLRDSGIKMGIISNAQFYTPLLFQAFLSHTYQELGFIDKYCFFSYHLGYAKPEKKMFKNAFSALQKDIPDLNANEIAYVGNDMLKDIYPAHECGFKTILFAGDTRSLRLRENDNRCSSIVPNSIVTSLQEIKTLCTMME